MTLALRYLLDTDMCIYLLNGDENVKSKIAQVGIETFRTDPRHLTRKLVEAT